MLSNYGRGFVQHAYFRDDWKLVRIPDNQGGTEDLLFDIRNDPYEQNDLSETHPEVFRQLVAELDAIPKAEPVSLNDRTPDLMLRVDQGPGSRTIGHPVARPTRRVAWCHTRSETIPETATVPPPRGSGLLRLRELAGRAQIVRYVELGLIGAPRPSLDGDVDYPQ